MKRLTDSRACDRLCQGAALAIGLLFASALAAEEKKPALTFEKDVLPIFRARCIRCHAGVEPKGGLNLSGPSSLLPGGKSGPAIRIAAAEFSLLYEKVNSDEMPADGPKLTAQEKGVIRSWINDGAAGVPTPAEVGHPEESSKTDLWSFHPPVRPPVPRLLADAAVANPIDAFIVASLNDAGLGLAPPADRLTLLRRAYFDLLGLPPTAAEIEIHLADQRPDAFERLVDRLLADPRYGERWGRHWLDVAGYAESAGILFEDRPLPTMYRYRDYVIRAFNSDKPYDQFLQEQIAGDELTDYWAAYETMDRLPDDVVEGITATGYLRTAADASRPDFATIKNADALYFYPTLFDTVQIVCSSTMGLTIHCARCHSHKFDPIPQADYYRMQAVFMGALRPSKWIPQMERELPVASKKQKDAADKRNAEVDANVKKLKEEQAATRSTFAAKFFEQQLGAIPEPIRADVKSAFAKAKEARTEVEKYLVEKFAATLTPEGDKLDQALKAAFPDFAPAFDKLQAQVAAEESRRMHFDQIRALYDLPGPTVTPVLLRGDPLTPGPDIAPGVFSAMTAPKPFAWSQAAGARSSGRRLAFARWLTQPEHPLTSRVLVNRVWMHHFGRGIVSTPEDFGVSGAPPSHPELLDWLATEFVRNGWSVKSLHRLILTSNTWRQQSRLTGEPFARGLKVDPENRLLWRQNLRRLDAEPLRDAVFAIAGLMSRKMYGSSDAVHRLGSGEVVVPTASQYRRSIYVMLLRLNPETILRSFDQPEMAVNCTLRPVSTVSTQALTLLNSEPMVKASGAFADRLLAERPDDRINQAVLAAFGRPAESSERAVLVDFLQQQTTQYLAASGKPTDADRVKAGREALADLCHMLLSANEFAYID